MIFAEDQPKWKKFTKSFVILRKQFYFFLKLKRNFWDEIPTTTKMKSIQIFIVKQRTSMETFAMSENVKFSKSFLA